MAGKPVISIKCPCCRSVLEVDTEAARVIAHRKGAHLKEDAKKGEDELAVALRNHEENRSKVEDQFRLAEDNVRNQASRLDALFDEARKKAARSKEDEDPDNPFATGKKVWD
jgi:hypothetical protein